MLKLTNQRGKVWLQNHFHARINMHMNKGLTNDGSMRRVPLTMKRIANERNGWYVNEEKAPT